MNYSCCDSFRRGLLEENKAGVNGVDFVEVSTSQELKLHFIRELEAKHPLGPANIRIEGGNRIRNLRVIGVRNDPDGEGKVLIAQVSQSGDSSNYTLRLVDPGDPTRTRPPEGYDPAFAAVEFSFRFKTRSEFDPGQKPACREETLKEPVIDYLAKDYASFRRLLLNRLATEVPDWKERHLPDLGITLIELLAYVGDRLSYQQDAIATEAYLGTARRRVSVRRHARLIDYHMHDGCNARAWVQVQVSTKQGVALRKGTQLLTRFGGKGVQEDVENAVIEPDSSDYQMALAQRAPVFETMHDITLYQQHNEMKFYTWGDQRCCLPLGATRATLAGDFGNLKPGNVLVFEEVCDPNSGQANDSDVRASCAVRLTGVRKLANPLPKQGKSPEIPWVTEIFWAEGDALPFALCISARTDAENNELDLPAVSVARGNIVLADHGQTVPPFKATFSAGDLKNPTSFAEKLAEHGDPISALVHKRLMEATTENTKPLVERLLDALNALVCGPLVWDEHHFSKVPERSEVKDLLKQTPNGADLRRLNRLLIEDSYPLDVERQGELLRDGRRSEVPDVTMFRAPAPGNRCEDHQPTPVMPRFRPTLQRRSLTRAVPYDETDVRSAASQLLESDPRQARPRIWLRSIWQSIEAAWEPKLDLLSSGPDEKEFVVETESEETIALRFGDSRHGLRPGPGTSFKAVYRVGNGASGNVGSEAIAYIVTDDFRLKEAIADRNVCTGGNAIRNPLPAAGGVDMESIEEVRNLAPLTMASKLERAVTEQDHAALVQNAFGRKIQKVAATFRWTGSWHTVFLAIDRFGGLPLDESFRKEIKDFLEPFRMAGYDVEVEEPRYVPLEIRMTVSVRSHAIRSDVKRALLDAFSNRQLGRGNRGLFHPDNLTFEQCIHLSRVYELAQSIPGVDHVHVTTFQRRDRPHAQEDVPDKLEFDRLEIPRLDNNRDFQEYGSLTVDMEGGR